MFTSASLHHKDQPPGSAKSERALKTLGVEKYGSRIVSFRRVWCLAGRIQNNFHLGLIYVWFEASAQVWKVI